MVDATFANVAVRIFLIRTTNHGIWKGPFTTDTSLFFLEVWKIYFRGWNLEGVFKDSKGYLGFGKCQSTNFASQIAAATLCCIQYNILSVAKRFLFYETIGGIFVKSLGKLFCFRLHNKYGQSFKNSLMQ